MGCEICGNEGYEGYEWCVDCIVMVGEERLKVMLDSVAEGEEV